MKQIVVGVADCRVVCGSTNTLITYALGSCVSISMFDPLTKTGGLLHFMLPDSVLDQAKATTFPLMFADTGIAALLHLFQRRDIPKTRLTVYLAGGAHVLDQSNFFEIGRRNCIAAKRNLEAKGMEITGEALGGTTIRTVSLDLSDGSVFVRENGGADKRLCVPGSGPKAVAGTRLLKAIGSVRPI